MCVCIDTYIYSKARALRQAKRQLRKDPRRAATRRMGTPTFK